MQEKNQHYSPAGGADATAEEAASCFCSSPSGSHVLLLFFIILPLLKLQLALRETVWDNCAVRNKRFLKCVRPLPSIRYQNTPYHVFNLITSFAPATDRQFLSAPLMSNCWEAPRQFYLNKSMMMVSGEHLLNATYTAHILFLVYGVEEIRWKNERFIGDCFA